MNDRKHTALVFLQSRPELFRDDFRDWLEENWHVYQEFEARASRLQHYGGPHNMGAKRLGSKMIWEAMRYSCAVHELSGEWKLNNTYTADCARLAMEMNPDLKGMFETRVSPLSRRTT